MSHPACHINFRLSAQRRHCPSVAFVDYQILENERSLGADNSFFFPSTFSISKMLTRKISILPMSLVGMLMQSIFWIGVVDALAFGGSGKPNTNQLEIAFVTGNEMKVTELSKILAKEGVLDLDDPDKSFGEPGRL